MCIPKEDHYRKLNNIYCFFFLRYCVVQIQFSVNLGSVG